MTLFANTFKSPCYEHLMGSSAQHFYDVVIITDRIEQGIKADKISKSIEKKGFTRKKKDVEVGNVERGYKGKKNYQNQNYQTQSYRTPSSQISSINFAKPLPVNRLINPQENQAKNNPKRSYQRNQEKLSHLSIPLKEMYEKLLSIGHVAPLPYLPLKPPFPNWYKLELTCEYYAGNHGHNIDTC